MPLSPIPKSKLSPPSRADIEAQLRKMIGSKTFSVAPQQVGLFAFLVKGRLAGVAMTQRYLNKEIFKPPQYKRGSPIAQKTVDLVRARLDKYYATEGKSDLVLISLPKSPEGKRVKFAAGEAYKAHFSYNLNHASMKEYQLGAYYSRRGGPTDLAAALEHYSTALKLHPGHTDALIGMIWVFLGASWSSKGEEKEGYLTNAENLINVALELFPNYWASHFVKASILAEKNDIAEAKDAYDRAFKLDRKSTQACARRTPLLRKLGDSLTQLTLAHDYLDEHTNDPEAYVVYGTILLTLQRYEEAKQSADAALKLDRNFLLGHYLAAAALTFEQRQSEAEFHVERMKNLADEATFAKVNETIRYIRIKLEE